VSVEKEEEEGKKKRGAAMIYMGRWGI